MGWVVNYFMIGVVTTLLLDWQNAKMNTDPEKRFANSERFWMIVLWPVMVGTFILAFFTNWFNND